MNTTVQTETLKLQQQETNNTNQNKKEIINLTS